MVVVECRAGEQCAVGMEGGARNWGGAVVVEEARVWLERRKIGAVHIKSLDFVAICTPVSC